MGHCYTSDSASLSNFNRHHKQIKEATPIHFSSDNTECYNNNFTLHELKEAISSSHDSASGPDEIHYQVLKHLPETSLNILIQLLNKIWISGTFPEVWKEATIIPISKPNKDSTNPQNYRPISLTSSLCKTFERIITNRLTWFLEQKNFIANIQSGFRKQRSTVDHLVRLETFIREALANKEHVVTVFFDLE